MKLILKEEQFNRAIIKEYHHAYGNGLEQDAENIAQIAIDMDKRNYGVKKYHIKSLDVLIDIKLVDSKVCGCSNYGDYIQIGKMYADEAIETKNTQRLSSLIYHELGHLVNFIKSNFSHGQTKRDFLNPLFLHLSDEEYKDIQVILYRFHTRELKARCFETVMFLKKNRDPNISIEDIYKDRCSDIYMMRGFINLLKQGAQEGPDSKYGKILSGLSRYTWEKNARSGKYRIWGGNEKITWKFKCKNTINYFEQRLRWLKKRIDKIFYDYKMGYFK